jgi:CPA2 family monovalent cation:H+ antiporter-2
VPRLVVEADARRVEELRGLGVPTLFGDAANSEVLNHAGLDHARALVVTVPDEAAAETVVAAARRTARALPIIARVATRPGVRRLAQLGAQDVIHPELEGGLEVVRHTLLRLGFPLREVQKYTDTVRQEHYDLAVNTDEEHRALNRLIRAARDIEIVWLGIPEEHRFVGRTLAEADIRARTGASVVALFREQTLIPNPKSQTVFEARDRIGLIGDVEQIEAATALLALPFPAAPVSGPPADVNEFAVGDAGLFPEE